MEEISISLPIADRFYKLAIENEHEELFRKAAKLIDKRLKDYSTSYAYKDKQDLLAMVALEYVTRYMQKDLLAENQESQWKTKLAELDHILDMGVKQ
ncbi:MAG: cell division protein ZapA [Alphaproteobacteria bacterium]|nr:cell division protein ZapA [Alphaproteobacteria bacterium]